MVGVLTAQQGSTVIPCSFSLVNNPNSYFAISGNNLITAKSGGMTVGAYSVQVNATPLTLSDLPSFTIAVIAPPLPNGTYIITSGSNAVDGGFGASPGHTPFVQLFTTNKGVGQQWVWNGATFQNVGIPLGGVSGAASGPFLAGAGDGTATENASGDTFILIKVTGGYNIQNARTANYLGIASNKLNFGTQKSVWTFAAA
jgi:hypothetical protein